MILNQNGQTPKTIKKMQRKLLSPRGREDKGKKSLSKEEQRRETKVDSSKVILCSEQ